MALPAPILLAPALTLVLGSIPALQASASAVADPRQGDASTTSAAERSAADGRNSESEGLPEYRVDFRAGRVGVDAKLSELELADRVVVEVSRYRLTSERLRLRRGPHGVVAEGSGRLSFCPCPQAPVSIGFQSVTLAPPTDVLIEQPTVRVGQVPVLWLPYLWLRSPARAGLLAPRVAFRGDDGFLTGFGFHVPVESHAGQELRGFDVQASAYFKGGWEVEGQWRGTHSTAYARWDYVAEHLLQLDTTYAETMSSRATVVGSVDAIRGMRGRRGTLLLEPAARAYDRAQLEVGRVSTEFGTGLGVHATAPRAGPIDSVGSWGPAGFMEFGGALGSIGAYSADVVLSQETEPEPEARLVEQARAEVTALPGPLAVQTAMFEQFDSLFRDDGPDVEAEAGASVLTSLPLRRRFGERRNLEHYVKPFVGFELSHRRWGLSPEEVIIAPVGVSTSFGDWARRLGASVDAGVGLVGGPSEPRRVAEALLITDGGVWAVQADARQDVRELDARQLAAMVRLGDKLGLHVTSYVEGAGTGETSEIPSLFFERRLPLASRWFAGDGWTGGAALGVPLTSWLAMAAATDYDLSEKRLLATNASLAYRHTCGCLGAVAWIGKRVGRDGFDIWLNLDLLP